MDKHRKQIISKLQRQLSSELELSVMGRIILRTLFSFKKFVGCSIIVIKDATIIAHAENDAENRYRTDDVSADGIPLTFEIPTETFDARSQVDLPANYPTRFFDNASYVRVIPLEIYKGIWAIVDIAIAKGEKMSALDMAFLNELLEEIKPTVLRGVRYGNIVSTFERDSLTQLYNRETFNKDIERFVTETKRFETSISCLMTDVDYFKKYNDTYGHQAGDEVLATVAKYIMQNIRPTDRAYRYGGEEFVVLLPDTDMANATVVARRICGVMNAADVAVTISIGVSTLPGDAATAEELVRIADLRLYRAKELGRNRIING